MREPLQPHEKADPPARSAPNPQEPKPPDPPGCHNCIHAIYDWADQVAAFNSCWPYRPLCSNHPDSPGRLRKVPVRGPCRNWRRKPEPGERGESEPPGTTTSHECKIALTKGLFATVDPADYEWLSRYRWHATCSRGRYYAATVIDGKSISMHRLIMNPPPGMQVDHKDTDRLDNHRYNLRLATPAQNRYNSRSCARKDRPKSSQYIGVTRRGDKWRTKITHEGHEEFLGSFDDEIEAALTWDARAKELRGEFAYLNFPDGPPPGWQPGKK